MTFTSTPDDQVEYQALMGQLHDLRDENFALQAEIAADCNKDYFPRLRQQSLRHAAIRAQLQEYWQRKEGSSAVPATATARHVTIEELDARLRLVEARLAS